MCQMIFTSDQAFFDKIGKNEIKLELSEVPNITDISKFSLIEKEN